MPFYYKYTWLLILLAGGIPATGFAGSTFVFMHGGAAGTGLEDSTPAMPVGGNTGTTRGEQRRIALEYAGEIWGRFLISPEPIVVNVNYQALGTSVLAAAGPVSIYQNFYQAPRSNTWYTVAHANSLAGYDLDPDGPDINVTVSSQANFYLGLDSQVPTGAFSFVEVMLHELAHGLGFLTMASATTAAFPSEQPDIYSRNIFDLDSGLAWDAMSNVQRQSSRVNNPEVVWTGPYTTAGHPFVLETDLTNDPSLSITAPVNLQKTIDFVPATFTPGFPAEGLVLPLILARDGSEAPGTAARACSSLSNPDETSGNIVLIRRGDCFFDEKILRAQQAGAVAVIVTDNIVGNLVAMASNDDAIASQVTIPAVFISKADGDALEAASPGVTLSMQLTGQDQAVRAGSRAGLMRLHAPATFSSGSSISHWTTEARPNLLMEPIINRNLDRNLDLTLTLMKDIGWRVVDIPFPHLTYDTWADEYLPAEVTERLPTDDPGGDGVTNLERYVFGLHPPFSHRALPTLVFHEGQPTLRYTRSNMPSDITIHYEKSSDLKTYVQALEGIDYDEEIIGEPGPQTREIEIRWLHLVEDPLFLRLRLGVK